MGNSRSVEDSSAEFPPFDDLSPEEHSEDNFPAESPSLQSTTSQWNFPEQILIEGVTVGTKKLGQGAFGEVFEATIANVRSGSGEKAVVKKLWPYLWEDSYLSKPQKDFIQECISMRLLSHPNCVRSFGVVMCYDDETHSTMPYLVMQHLDKTLESAFKDDLSDQVKLDILRDISLGLNYMHTRDPVVLHRDLSARNVLLDTSGRRPVAKLSDFGGAKLVSLNSIQYKKLLSNQPGTVWYMPPEALNEDSESCVYGRGVDIFSFGVLMLALLNNDVPKPTEEYTMVDGNKEFLTEVERRQHPLSLIKEHRLLPLIESCLSNNPKQRPSASELCFLLQQCSYTRKGSGVLFGLKFSCEVIAHHRISEMKERTIHDIPSKFTVASDSPEQIKLPCGHYVTATVLIMWCRSLMEEGHTRLYCPAACNGSPCNEEWELSYVQDAAALNTTEQDYFSRSLSSNTMQEVGVKSCPVCGQYTDRLNVKSLQMVCSSCNFSFCAQCNRKWCKSQSSTDHCRLIGCDNLDLLLLKDSPTIKIGDEEVPQCRACPECGRIKSLHDGDSIKFVKCRRCGNQFCFLCLKLRSAASHNLNGECLKPIAPIQKSIPSWSRVS